MEQQPNFTHKTTGKRRAKPPKISRRKESLKIQAETNEKEMKETIVKINKTKSWFFEKIKLTNIQPDSSRKREESYQQNQNEKGEVTTDNAEIQTVIRDYHEQLYGNKMDNLEKMDRSLEKFSLPRLNQEEIEIMNNPITSTEIEAVVKISQKTKAQDQMASQKNSIKYLEKS